MKRSRTEITAWPAVADLMTAVVVITFLTGAIVYYGGSSSQISEDLSPESFETLLKEVDAFRDSILILIANADSLRDSVDELRDSVEILIDEQEGAGDPNCLSRDTESLMTIRFDPNSYIIQINQLGMTLDFAELEALISPYDQRAISTVEMTTLAKSIDQFGDNYNSCNFFVNIENGGISSSSLQLRWMALAPYFAGAINWQILYE